MEPPAGSCWRNSSARRASKRRALHLPARASQACRSAPTGRAFFVQDPTRLQMPQDVIVTPEGPTNHNAELEQHATVSPPEQGARVHDAREAGHSYEYG